jgi:NADH:ubiquinone oxidoreductase subunit 4 (subunit M)
LVFRVLFFGSLGLLMMFMLFELVILPVFLMIMVYGTQPEKVSAGYYALLYTSTFSFPFLGVVISLERWPSGHYTSPLLLFYSLGLFLVKRPLFIIHH